MAQLSSARAALPLLLALAVVACGDDDATGTTDAGPMADAAPGDAGIDAGEEPPVAGAALCSVVFGPDGTTGFVRFVPDDELNSGEVIDSAAGGFEFGGVTCLVRGRNVYAHDWESATITRYEVERDGALVERDRVSLAGLGITSFSGGGDNLVIASDERAYFLSQSGILAAWDPSTMSVVGDIDIAPLFDTGDADIEFNGARVLALGDRVGVFPNYLTPTMTQAAGARVGFVDPATDAVTFSAFTEQCGNVQSQFALAENGDAYFGHSGAVSMEHALGLPGSFPPCSIRIREGATEFDATYTADLNALTGGRPTAGPVPLTPGRALLYAFDTDAMPIDPEATQNELWAAANWSFFLWEPGSDAAATPVPELGVGSGFVDSLVYGGETYLRQFALDLSGTELISLDDDTLGEVAFRLSNLTNSLNRIE
ncbi:MAG: hypothetical protein AAGH15_14315 [Myxococcota bacterium]